jgi:hypothetical protein
MEAIQTDQPKCYSWDAKKVLLFATGTDAKVRRVGIALLFLDGVEVLHGTVLFMLYYVW